MQPWSTLPTFEKNLINLISIFQSSRRGEIARLFCCNETNLSMNFTVSTSVREEQNQSLTEWQNTWFQHKFHAIKSHSPKNKSMKLEQFIKHGWLMNFQFCCPMLTHNAKRRAIFYRMNETGASDKIMVGSFFGSMDILALHTSATVPGWQVVDTVPPSVYPTHVTFLSNPCHHLHQNLMQCYQRSF